MYISVLYQTKDLGQQQFYALALRHCWIYRSNTGKLINFTTDQFLILSYKYENFTSVFVCKSCNENKILAFCIMKLLA